MDERADAAASHRFTRLRRTDMHICRYVTQMCTTFPNHGYSHTLSPDSTFRKDLRATHYKHC